MSTWELAPVGHYHRGHPEGPCEECGQHRGHPRHTCIHGSRSGHATTLPPLGDGHCSGPGSLWPVREGIPGQDNRVEGEVLAHLDAVALAARQLFESLQLAVSTARGTTPVPPAAECRHCARALQLGPTPGQDPLLFSSVSWLDADGSASCRGQLPLRAQDPGTYLPHEPMPARRDPTGLPLHRCPGCQMLHPFPVAVEV